MTTIIIIVVVALVFFVTVCVVTFMVWKREAEIRTDSIRAIESNLERLGDRLSRCSRRSRLLCRKICTKMFADRCCGLQNLLAQEDLEEAEAGAGAEIRSAGFAVNRRWKKLRRQKRSSRRSGHSRNLCNRHQKCR